MVAQAAVKTAYVFKTIAERGKAYGVTRMDYMEAARWYRAQAKKVRSVDINQFMNEAPKSRFYSRMSDDAIGSLTMFWYDPKHKDTLPYHDQFPLVWPLEDYGQNFLGLNIHYISPYRRAQLMNAMYDLAQKEKDKIVRLRLSYKILKAASKFSAFKPCVKEYIKGHVRSRFFYVAPNEWDTCLFLPTERFVGAKKDQVWRDSNRIIRGG